MDVIVAKVRTLELKDGDLVCITAPPNAFRPGEIESLMEQLRVVLGAAETETKHITMMVWPNDLEFTIIRQGEIEKYKLNSKRVP